jgi:hypothetical protein
MRGSRRRIWWAVLIALMGAGALSGCYYDAFTGYWRPYPWYYPFYWGYPYYAYPPPPPPQANPPPGYPPPGAAAPPNAPVQRAPLPPPS